MRKRTPLEPYSSPLLRVLGTLQGGGRFLRGEVYLQLCLHKDGRVLKTHREFYMHCFFWSPCSTTNDDAAFAASEQERGVWRVLTQKYRGTSLIRNSSTRRTIIALCLGTYGDPMGVGVSYERGTPVLLRVVH